MNVPPSKRPHLYIVTEEREAFENGRDYLCRLAYAGEVIVSDDVPADADKMVSIVTKDASSKRSLPISRNRSVSSADAHIIRLTKVSRNATMTLRDIF